MEDNLPKHECKNFIKKVFLVLDGELPETERNLFINDIQRCKGCLEHYHIEKTFKDFLSNNLERKCCSTDLKNSILNQIKEIQSTEE